MDIIIETKTGEESICDATAIVISNQRFNLEDILNRTVVLFGGYIWDAKNQSMSKNNTNINLTRIEKKIIKQLLSQETTSIEEFREKVWKNGTMSMYTLRNHISAIRRKTEYGIIKTTEQRYKIIKNEENKNAK